MKKIKKIFVLFILVLTISSVGSIIYQVIHDDNNVVQVEKINLNISDYCF